MQKKVIGTIGKNASGKDTVVDILRHKFGVLCISMGDIVRDIAREKGIEPTRKNLNEVSRSHFADHGPEFFINKVIERIDGADAPYTVISGIRTYTDAKTLLDRYDSHFLLIHVLVSDDAVRLNRALHRAAARDPKTIEEFTKDDAREESIFGLDRAASLAMTTLTNDGSLAELEEKVGRWVDEHLPGLRVWKR
jgi:dephospho-CoA kinase